MAQLAHAHFPAQTPPAGSAGPVLPFEEALRQWFIRHPLPVPPEGKCARCGFPLIWTDGSEYRDGDHMQPVPTHDLCVVKLAQERRAAATAALAAAEIREPGK